MKWINDRDEKGIIGSVLQMTPEEFDKLLPMARKELEKVTKMRDKIGDIFEGGEATDKQTDILMRLNDEVEYWKEFCKI